MQAQQTIPLEAPVPCPVCEKFEPLCICAHIKPVQTRTSVLILQHPQEPDKALGTARMTHLMLPNSSLKVGLSWPNLKAALGKEATPKQWLALHLGSVRTSALPRGEELIAVNKKGVPLEEQREVLSAIRGIVILDGTWSQAKALWWRNAWLLKLQRAVLNPSAPSLYQRLRREPRRECISTIESVAVALSVLERQPGLKDDLLVPLRALLEKAKAKQG